MDRLCELSFDAFTTPERLRALERLERVSRRLLTPQHAVINEVAAQASNEELGGTLSSAFRGELLSRRDLLLAEDALQRSRVAVCLYPDGLTVAHGEHGRSVRGFPGHGGLAEHDH